MGKIWAIPRENFTPAEFEQIECNFITLFFLGALKFGMLALNMLPSNSVSNIVMITDGEFAIPTIEACDALLNR